MQRSSENAEEEGLLRQAVMQRSSENAVEEGQLRQAVMQRSSEKCHVEKMEPDRQ